MYSQEQILIRLQEVQDMKKLLTSNSLRYRELCRKELELQKILSKI